MFKIDKIKHAIVGFISGFGFSFIVPEPISFFIVTVIGIGKEYMDAGLPKGHFIRTKIPQVFSPAPTFVDNKDIFATAIGGLLGTLLHFLTFKTWWT